MFCINVCEKEKQRDLVRIKSIKQQNKHLTCQAETESWAGSSRKPNFGPFPTKLLPPSPVTSQKFTLCPLKASLVRINSTALKNKLYLDKRPSFRQRFFTLIDPFEYLLSSSWQMRLCVEGFQCIFILTRLFLLFSFLFLIVLSCGLSSPYWPTWFVGRKWACQMCGDTVTVRVCVCDRGGLHLSAQTRGHIHANIPQSKAVKAHILLWEDVQYFSLH